MDYMKEQVLQSVRRYSRRIKSHQLHFKPDFPKKALANSLKHIPEGVQEEDVVMLYDSTFFGAGKKGILMTHRSLYSFDKKGETKQINLLDIVKVSIRNELPSYLNINGNDFHKFSLSDQDEVVRWFKDILMDIYAVLKSQERNELIEKKKDDVLKKAEAWWLHKQDPKDGGFVCDACNGLIREKHGTSLLGSYMRCSDCTRKLFSRWDTGEI